jgi:hypothetical protein
MNPGRGSQLACARPVLLVLAVVAGASCRLPSTNTSVSPQRDVEGLGAATLKLNRLTRAAFNARAAVPSA